MLSRARALVLPLLVALLALVPALARPAGETQTRLLDPFPVTIHYPPRYGRVAEKVDQIARAELPRLMSEVGLTELTPIEIVVTADARAYDRSLSPELPNWGVAFAILEQQRILVDVHKATRAFNSLDEVVPHELSHLLVRQRVPDADLPIWFSEGMAQWQAREWSLADSWQLMQGVWSGSAPRIVDLVRHYPADEARAQDAYRISYAAFTYLFEGVGFGKLPEFLGTVERNRSFGGGFSEYWGFSTSDFAAYFQDDIERRYKSKSFVFQDGPLFGFAALVFIAVVVRQYFKRRKKFAQLEE